MGQVLAKGGFTAEAVPPVRDAVELSVRALALLAGIDAAGDANGAVTAAVIQGTLVAKDFLAGSDAANVSVLREVAAAPDGADGSTARRLIEAGTRIVEKASARCARDALRR